MSRKHKILISAGWLLMVAFSIHEYRVYGFSHWPQFVFFGVMGSILTAQIRRLRFPLLRKPAA